MTVPSLASYPYLGTLCIRPKHHSHLLKGEGKIASLQLMRDASTASMIDHGRFHACAINLASFVIVQDDDVAMDVSEIMQNF